MISPKTRKDRLRRMTDGKTNKKERMGGKKGRTIAFSILEVRMRDADIFRCEDKTHMVV